MDDATVKAVGRDLLEMLAAVELTTRRTGNPAVAVRRLERPTGIVTLFVVNDEEMANVISEALKAAFDCNDSTPPSQVH